MSEVSQADRERLRQAARAAWQNSYAPYSKFRVGAAILTDSGEVFTGCNVENASYGLTNCAERTAIFSAVAKLGGKMRLFAVAVDCEQAVSCGPCGACRQVIYEFGPEATVLFRDENGPTETHITKLLPYGFRLIE
jgi:cytidine deaminase